MSEVDDSLKKMAKGTTIVLAGTFISMLLLFFGRVLIIRYITQTEYGLLSLSTVILNIFITVACLGLGEGVARYIAYFRGENDNKKIAGIIISSIQIAVIAGILCSLLAFLASDIISEVFHSPDLSPILKIFAMMIPFYVMINIFVSIFRGFDKVNVRVYFHDVLRALLNILFFITVIFLSLSFIGIIYAYLASIIVTCIAFTVYTAKKLPVSIRGDFKPMRKKLLYFSLPLLTTSMLSLIMSWTDTLMLGYFKTPDIVGLYNAALPISHLIPIVLTSMIFIYVPIVSQLYSKNLIVEMRRTYAVLTKWIFSITLPLFLVVFLFPDTVLGILFGVEYMQADTALRILSLGFFIHAFLGPNGSTLLVMGKTRLLMMISMISVIVNVILNILLIPPMGIVGAAIASASTFATINILALTKLYMLSKIHPFTRNYLKPIIISVIFVLITYFLTINIFPTVPFWLLPPLSAIFLGIYFLSLLLTKSFDKEDIMILLTIEQRLGINLMPIKRILKRFV